MGDIITPEQLSSRMQEPTLDRATAELAIANVESDIRFAVGTIRYDALADKSPLAGVALTVASRIAGNPAALRTSKIDDSTDGFSESSVYLTKTEIRLCRRATGRRSGGAFSIAPSPPPVRVCGDATYCCHTPVCHL